MPDATASVTTLVPRTGTRRTAPLDCGVARVIDLPARPTARIVDPMPAATARGASGSSSAVRVPAPGPLARALMSMAATGR